MSQPSQTWTIAAASGSSEPKTNLDAAWEVCRRHKEAQGHGVIWQDGPSFDSGFYDCELIWFQHQHKADLETIERALKDPNGKP